MKVFLSLVVFFTFLCNLNAQDNKKLITLSFTNETKQQVFYKIENNTSYSFFYIDKWLDARVFSGDFKEVPIESILDSLFTDSELNFIILEDTKVILTQNNLVYDELPDLFFGDSLQKKTQIITQTAINPVLVNKSKINTNNTIETFKIGREQKNTSTNSYELKGYITNEESLEPIIGLSILVEGTNIFTITDANGFYKIQLPTGENILDFKSMGIENVKKRVIIYNNGVLNVGLREGFELLNEVIVQADANKNIDETAGGTVSIDVEESKNIPLVLGERDVLKVATTLPGISTTGEGSEGFNVRGGNSDQNLILFDDAVIYNPQHFFGIFSALNPFALGSVNIYKGSMPSEFGGRLSSVFDIKTINGNNEKIVGEGSVGPVTSNILLEVPVVKGKSSLIFGGRAAYSNWLLRSLNEESLNSSQASFYDFLVSYNHKINDNNNIKATGYISRDDFSIASDSLFGYENKIVSLKWDHKFSDRSSGNIVVSNSQYIFDIGFESDRNNDFLLDYKLNETEAKIKANYAFNSKFKLDFGLSTKLYTINPGNIEPKGNSTIQSLTIAEERALESAVFVSRNFDIDEKLSFETGLRYSFYAALGESVQRAFESGEPRNEDTVNNTINYDRNEVVKTYGAPEIRLSGRYKFFQDLAFKMSYSNTVQYIHRLSNNVTVSPIDTWKLSDLNIEPQRGQQVSLGLFKNFESNIYEVSLEGFYKKSTNILDFKTGAELLLNQNIDTEVLQGEGKSYGVELLLAKNVGKFNGWLGYTYSRSFLKLDSAFDEERINEGNFFPSNFDKPHDFSFVANYKFTKRFSLATNFVYQTGRPITVPVGNFSYNNNEYVVFSDRNSFRIPDFIRLDLGFNIEGNHKKQKLAHSFWTFSIYNVLGRNNPFSVFFINEDDQIKAVQTSIFAIPVPSITYNFKF